MKKKILTLLLTTMSLLTSIAQDAEFTQFYANPLYLNPALTGMNLCTRVSINYRYQWPGIYGTYITSAASVDRLLTNYNSGIGLMVLNDKAGKGTLTTNLISGLYAYQIKNRKYSISIGARVTYGEKSIDWTKLTFGDMIDPKYGFVFATDDVHERTKKSYLDFSSGIFAMGKYIYGGVAIDHLTEPDEGLIGTSILPRKYTAHAGALLPIHKHNNHSASISPNILYQRQQDFEQLNLGIYINKEALVGGFWYRHAMTTPDAIMLLIGIQNHLFKIGYSYDITISRLTNVSFGAHELSFGMQIRCKKPIRKHRPQLCPSF